MHVLMKYCELTSNMLGSLAHDRCVTTLELFFGLSVCLLLFLKKLHGFTLDTFLLQLL